MERPSLKIHGKGVFVPALPPVAVGAVLKKQLVPFLAGAAVQGVG